MCKHKLNPSYFFHKAFLVFSCSTICNLSQWLVHKLISKLYAHIVKRSERSLVGKIESLSVKDILYRKANQYKRRCSHNICHCRSFTNVFPDKIAYQKIRHNPYGNAYRDKCKCCKNVSSVLSRIL